MSWPWYVRDLEYFKILIKKYMDENEVPLDIAFT